MGLETLLGEIDKLDAIARLGLPAELFADASEKLVQAWRARAARSYPSDLRAAPRPVRLTLLAALCWVRSAEVTDALVDLLIGLVHKINARADRRVERELIGDLRRVRGKESILFRLAEAAIEHPDDTVREALFPTGADREHAETSMLTLTCCNRPWSDLRYPADPGRLGGARIPLDLIGDDERRALTPLFWSEHQPLRPVPARHEHRLDLASGTEPATEPVV